MSIIFNNADKTKKIETVKTVNNGDCLYDAVAKMIVFELDDFKENLTDCLLDRISLEELIEIFKNDVEAYKYIEGDSEIAYKERIKDLIYKTKTLNEWPTDGMVKLIAKCIDRDIFVFTNQIGNNILYTYYPSDYLSENISNDGIVDQTEINRILNEYMNEPKNAKSPILIYNVENIHYVATKVVDVPESVEQMDFVEEPASGPASSPAFVPVNALCPPPTRATPHVNPQSEARVEYYFSDEKGVNVFSQKDAQGNPINPGIIELTPGRNIGSVANITKSIKDVLLQICANVDVESIKVPAEKKKFIGIKSALEKYDIDSGRELVASDYSFFSTNLQALNDIINKPGSKQNPYHLMEERYLKSYFIGASAIKALMDSGPLGEGVLRAILNNLSPCFTDLAITGKDIKDYITIFNGLKKDDKVLSITDLIKYLDFWLTIEYCRVFQLVSSDVLGAVNGCFILREIINETFFTGFITIPKGSGGELGLDNKICIYSLFLFNVMTGNPQNFVTLDDRKEYQEKLMEFYGIINDSKEFLNVLDDTSNFMSIERAVKIIMESLENGSEGTLGGSYSEKDDKFYATYNTYKIITLFADFIRKNTDIFDRFILDLNASYTSSVLQTANSNWMTWLCFQLSRYQQTQKVYAYSYEPSRSESESDILTSFNERKNMYCTKVKSSGENFKQAWYKATQQVYINEAFAGHDNKSYELTKMAIEVFGTKTEVSKTSKSRGKQEVDPDESKLKIGKVDMSFYEQFVVKEKYSEHTPQVITKVLQETNCTFFLESVNIPDNSDVWTIGKSGADMVFKRDLVDKKFPVSKPANGLLDIITGRKEKDSQTSIFIVVDLAKYVPEAISNIRSIADLNTIIGPNLAETANQSKMELDEASEKLSESAELYYRNQLITQTLMKRYNTGTVYSSILSRVDAASFTFPPNAVYMTGKLEIPINVGNGITMNIKIKVGSDDSYQNGLHTKIIQPSKEPLFSEEDRKGKEAYATCLEYFSEKYDENKDNLPILKSLGKFIKDKLPKNRELLLTKSGSLFADKYKDFLKILLKNITPDAYKVFLEAVIPNTTFLNSSNLFTATGSKGTLWETLIFRIANDSVYVASVFIDTIPSDYKSEPKIKKCETAFKEFIKFIENIQFKYRSVSRTSVQISTRLKQIIESGKITGCNCTLDKNGNVVFTHATFDELKKSFPEEFQAFEETILQKGVAMGEESMKTSAEGAHNLMMIYGQRSLNATFSGQGSSFNETSSVKRPYEETSEIYETPPKKVKTIHDVKKEIQELQFILTIKKKELEDYKNKYSDNIKKNIRKDDLKSYKKYLLDEISLLETKIKLSGDLIKIMPDENIGSQDVDSDMESQTYDSDMESQPYDSDMDLQGGGGSAEIDIIEGRINQLDIELAELKVQQEQLLISMLTFTDGPISELELVKTAAFLGPELYDEIALIQAEETAELYNKVLAMNAGNIEFNVPIDPQQISFSGTDSLKHFIGKVVAVKLIDGKYYMESMAKYLQPEAESLPTQLVENVQEVFTDVKETIADGYEDIVENADALKEKILGKPSEPTTSEPTTSEPTTSEPTTSEPTIDVEDEGYGDMIYSLKENIMGKPEKLASTPTSAPIAAAAAAGGSKHTKKQMKRGKKLTKRKQKKSKKSNNFTKRKRGGKKPKKTKRRN